MENLTDRQKYLVVKNGIFIGKIEENNLLNGFMDTVALHIIKGYPLTDKQNEVLNVELEKVMNYISDADQLLIDKLDEEALNTDVNQILLFQKLSELHKKFKGEDKEKSDEVKNKRAYEAMLKIKEKKKLAQENGN